MSRISDSIKARKFTGSSVPAGSELGRRLLNSRDSRKIIAAIRATVKDKPQTVKLSEETMESLREP